MIEVYSMMESTERPMTSPSDSTIRTKFCSPLVPESSPMIADREERWMIESRTFIASLFSTLSLLFSSMMTISLMKFDGTNSLWPPVLTKYPLTVASDTEGSF